MPTYSKSDVDLVRYPFTDLSSSKVRPAAIINTPHISEDFFVVPLTSKTTSLLPGEFVLEDWKSAGLNVAVTFAHQWVFYEIPDRINGGNPSGNRSERPNQLVSPISGLAPTSFVSDNQAED